MERADEIVMAKSSSMIKVAGLSLLGFCAASYVADKMTGTEAAQLAGYCGAFAGALVGRARAKRQGGEEVQRATAEEATSAAEPESATEQTSAEVAHSDNA